MSEVYANVPMYIDWIMNKKRLHDTIGRDESNDVTTAEPLFFEIVLNIFLTSQIFQIYWLQNDKNKWVRECQLLVIHEWVSTTYYVVMRGCA